MAGIEKLCEYSGIHAGHRMWHYKRNHIQVLPKHRKMFEKQFYILFIFKKETVHRHKGTAMEHHPYFYRKVGSKWYEWRGKRYSNKELLRLCKGVVTEYMFTLYVPSVPGQVQGLYTNWTTDLGATKRRLKRMLKCKRLRTVRLDMSYSDFRGTPTLLNLLGEQP